VLLKANIPTAAAGSFSSETPLGALLRSPHLLALILGAVVLLVMSLREGRRWAWSQVAIALFVATAVLHLAVARVGWLYRYEAYLVFMGVTVVAVGLEEEKARLWPRSAPLAWRALALAAFAVLVLPLAQRGAGALWRTPRASKNIHEQQFQMGSFLGRYYRGGVVAANDVGAIAWLSDARLLDLFGLADLEVGKKKLQGAWNTDAIRATARQRGVKVAVVYDAWFEKMGGVPREWVRAGEWTIIHNVVCGSDRVTWYAVDPAEAPSLIRRLREFSRLLPPDVKQDGAYLAGAAPP
jgi:hypothetical protein